MKLIILEALHVFGWAILFFLISIILTAITLKKNSINKGLKIAEYSKREAIETFGLIYWGLLLIYIAIKLIRL